MDADIFIVYIEANDIFKDIAENFETRLQTSNYEIDRTLPKERKKKNKKVIGLMKNKLSGKIMPKFLGWRPKAYSYLIDDIKKTLKRESSKEKLNFKIIKMFRSNSTW